MTECVWIVDENTHIIHVFIVEIFQPKNSGDISISFTSQISIFNSNH